MSLLIYVFLLGQRGSPGPPRQDCPPPNIRDFYSSGLTRVTRGNENTYLTYLVFFNSTDPFESHLDRWGRLFLFESRDLFESTDLIISGYARSEVLTTTHE